MGEGTVSVLRFGAPSCEPPKRRTKTAEEALEGEGPIEETAPEQARQGKSRQARGRSRHALQVGVMVTRLGGGSSADDRRRGGALTEDREAASRPASRPGGPSESGERRGPGKPPRPDARSQTSSTSTTGLRPRSKRPSLALRRTPRPPASLTPPTLAPALSALCPQPSRTSLSVPLPPPPRLSSRPRPRPPPPPSPATRPLSRPPPFARLRSSTSPAPRPPPLAAPRATPRTPLSPAPSTLPSYSWHTLCTFDVNKTVAIGVELPVG